MTPASDLISQTGIGNTPIMAGRGYLILTGAGRLSIMAAGSMILPMDGCGYPVMSGHRHG